MKVYCFAFADELLCLLPHSIRKIAEIIDVESINDLDKMDKDSFLLFSGGEDISPSLYGEVAKATGASNTPSRRDTLEREGFLHAQKVGARSLGICRGSQFLCAMSGGKLYQDVNGHLGVHKLNYKYPEDSGVDSLFCNSTHHQMMDIRALPQKDRIIIGWAKQATRLFDYEQGKHRDREMGEIDPEIVYFRKTKSLAIQGHPEYNDCPLAFVHYCKNLIAKHIDAEIV